MSEVFRNILAGVLAGMLMSIAIQMGSDFIDWLKSLRLHG